MLEILLRGWIFLNKVMNIYKVMDFYDMSYHTVRSLRLAGMPSFKVNKKESQYIYEEIESWLNPCGRVFSDQRFLIKRNEAMEMLGLTKSEFQWLLLNNKIPHFKLGTQRGFTIYRFDYKEIENYANRQKRGNDND